MDIQTIQADYCFCELIKSRTICLQVNSSAGFQHFLIKAQKLWMCKPLLCPRHSQLWVWKCDPNFVHLPGFKIGSQLVNLGPKECDIFHFAFDRLFRSYPNSVPLKINAYEIPVGI